MNTRVLKGIIPLGLCVILGFFEIGLALQQNSTEQGLYLVSLDFAGSQGRVGKNSMKLSVMEYRSKAPVKEKLDIEVVPWMPAHEHGASGIPVVKELGKGEFSVENVNFTMPGLWEIYVRINKGKKGEDTAVFNLNVK